jgi:hypothetical protein
MSGYIVHGTNARHGKNIMKGWDNIGNIKAFKDEFQLVIMEVSATTSLLNVTPDIEEFDNGINRNGNRSNRSNFDNNGGMFATSKHNHNINCNYKLYIY